MRPISFHCAAVIVAALLLGGCASGKGIAEDCDYDDECASNCCYDAQSIHPWCTEDYSKCIGSSSGSTSSPPEDTSDSDSSDKYDIDGCGTYADAGLPDAQTKAYCHAAYSHRCDGNRDEARTACDVLSRFGTQYEAMCPYCQS